MFSQLILQLVFILFPLFIYHSYLKDTKLFKQRRELLNVLTCGVSIVLCMSFPVAFGEGKMMDLRSVPWLLGFLYGGLRTGLLLTVIMFSYRIYLGGESGIFAAITTTVLTMALVYPFLKRYLNEPLSKKLMISTSIVAFNSLLVVILVNYMFNLTQVTLFYLFFILLHILTIAIVVYLIETFRENSRLQKKLLQAEKLNLIGQMSATVAHEIRNPLTVIRGFGQLMHHADDIPKKHKKNLEMILAEVERAQHVIDEYLTLAKPEAATVTVIDVKESIECVHELLKANESGDFSDMKLREIELKYDMDEDELYTVIGNRDKLQQVFYNILQNAIEASPDRGVVQVQLVKLGQKIHIMFSDNGKGMTREQLERIGTPFYSTKEKGTGLGLSVAYNIVQSMNGHIEVTSDANGSCFTVTLPIAGHV